MMTVEQRQGKEVELYWGKVDFVGVKSVLTR